MADGLSLFDFLLNGCITFALCLLPEQSEAFIPADSYILCVMVHIFTISYFLYLKLLIIHIKDVHN